MRILGIAAVALAMTAVAANASLMLHVDAGTLTGGDGSPVTTWTDPASGRMALTGPCSLACRRRAPVARFQRPTRPFANPTTTVSRGPGVTLEGVLAGTSEKGTLLPLEPTSSRVPYR